MTNERKAIDTLKDMIAEGQYNGADIVARDDEVEVAFDVDKVVE